MRRPTLLLLAAALLLSTACGIEESGYSYEPRSIGQADVIAYGPHERLYLLNPYYDAVVRWDLGSDKVRLFDVCERPSDMALSADASRIVVACTHEGRFSSIDLSSGKVRTIDTNPLPWAVAVDPQGRRAVVAEYAGDSLLIVDLRTMQRRRAFVPGGPVEVEITDDGATAVVAAYWDNAVSLVNLDTREVTRLAGEPYDFDRPQDVLLGRAGTSSAGLAFIAGAGYYTDEGRLASRLVAVDPRDGAFVSAVEVGPGPHALTLNDAGDALITLSGEFVEQYPARTASLVSIAADGVLQERQRFVVQEQALAAAAVPDAEAVVVANYADDSLSLLDLDRLTSRHFAVSVRPFGLVARPDGRYVFSAHDHPLGSVSILDMVSGDVRSVDSLIFKDILED